MRTKFGWRLLALLAVLAFVVAACGDDEAATTTAAPTTTAAETTTTAPEETTTTAPEETTTTAPEIVYANACMEDVTYDTTPYAGVAPEAPAGGFTYRTGVFQDFSTDNFWAYLDPQSTVWNAFLLGPTKPALFAINLPGLEVVADLAASDDPGVAAADGDGYSVTVAMREDGVWSDGTPITAQDVVFTADTVCRFALGGNWTSSYQWAQVDAATGEPKVNPATGGPVLGLTAVEAIDDYTVKFTFNAMPGLAVWPHGPGLAPIMPKHVWQAVVENAKASEDPAEVLYGASGIGDVSGGPTVFRSWEAGAFAQVVANPNYYDEGREITSGGVTFTVGPYLSNQTFAVYGDQSAAVLALKADEVDFLYNSLGLQRGLLSQIEDDPNLTPIINSTYGFRYMAFNLRKEPMSLKGFREAVAFMIDKEYVSNRVLQGVAYPLYATMPAGNVAWFNEEKAAAYAATYRDLTQDTRWDGEPFVDEDGASYVATGTEARLHAAVKALMADGFSWPEGQTPDYIDGAIVPGSGIMLNGTPVDQELVLLAPGPGYDPLRATYSLIIAQAISDLGFNCRALPTDFNVLVNTVYIPDDNGELTFDMYLLGWSLGSPVLPTYHESFWAGKNDTLLNDGNNAAGFHNDEYDALVEEFNAATTFEAAYDILWQMEDILFEEKPNIPLFDTGIIEAYRSAAVMYPFTSTLSGLQFGNGFPGLVMPAAQ